MVRFTDDTKPIGSSRGRRLWAMDRARLRELLDDVASGAVGSDEAARRLEDLPFADLGDALVDHHRTLRQGAPEVVYGPGKTPDQCVRIVGELMDASDLPVLATRLEATQLDALTAAFGAADVSGGAALWRAPHNTNATVAVVTAGTSDLPVADEAAITLRSLGLAATRVTDVGVSGLHRLLAALDPIRDADAVIVVAGMEGALASVVGGLVSSPVIAVPTSVGYGSGFDGVTALLAMTASCASGVSVVGIDNGFGAAMAAGRILRVHDR